MLMKSNLVKTETKRQSFKENDQSGAFEVINRTIKVKHDRFAAASATLVISEYAPESGERHANVSVHCERTAPLDIVPIGSSSVAITVGATDLFISAKQAKALLEKLAAENGFLLA